ncbi:hypothetical protein BDZ89DRAFT_564630 [Hymenopellis radicata]|nr:hypothetical protein BDZ89DRAFT_564630 [Hymenopellis radicata]
MALIWRAMHLRRRADERQVALIADCANSACEVLRASLITSNLQNTRHEETCATEGPGDAKAAAAQGITGCTVEYKRRSRPCARSYSILYVSCLPLAPASPLSYMRIWHGCYVRQRQEKKREQDYTLILL